MTRFSAFRTRMAGFGDRVVDGFLRLVGARAYTVRHRQTYRNGIVWFFVAVGAWLLKAARTFAGDMSSLWYFIGDTVSWIAMLVCVAALWEAAGFGQGYRHGTRSAGKVIADQAAVVVRRERERWFREGFQVGARVVGTVRPEAVHEVVRHIAGRAEEGR